MPAEITMIETYDSAMILDQEENEWSQGWLKVYKRQRTVDLFKSESISTTEKFSSAFLSAPYEKALMEINATAAAVASTLCIDVEFSDDNSNWYENEDIESRNIQLQRGDGNRKLCVQCPVMAQYMRVKSIATAGTWTLTAKAILIT